MSEPLESQELKPVSDCHPSPQYHVCEPSPNILISVIENERAARLAVEQNMEITTRVDNFIENLPMRYRDYNYGEAENNTNNNNYLQDIEFFDNFSLLVTEWIECMTEISNILKERLDHPEIYIAMGRLSDSEFNRAYASLKESSNHQTQRELAQDSHSRGDYSCSSGRLLESSKVDNSDDKLGQSPPSYDTATHVWRPQDSTPARCSRRFWKKLWKH